MTPHDHARRPADAAHAVHGHDHPHGHGHAHGHHHPEPGSVDGRTFRIAIGLNIAFVIAEVVYGLFANSTALLADAGHNLSDVLGLGLAWGAAALGRRPAAGRFTWGLRGSSILAALANGLLLVFACGAIAWEAANRFFEPAPVAGMTVIVVAAIGIAINFVSARLFIRGQDDLNVRGAYLHLMADAAVSLGVVIAGVLIVATGWNWVDPVISLAIVGVIFWSTWGLLRESALLALNAAPSHLDTAEIGDTLVAHPGVQGVHDLHVWAISTTDTVLSAHLVVPDGDARTVDLDGLRATLADRYAIRHATLQVEAHPCNPACSLTRP